MVSVIKCVVIGDESVGKTSALVTYSSTTFPTEHVPTVFDNYVVTEFVGGNAYTLNLFDTGGQQHSHHEMCSLIYHNINVFLVCFSVVRQSSFESVRHKWVPEIRRYCGLDAQYILVGTQIDLRDDNTIIESLVKNNARAVTREDGEKLARELLAVKYVECSALTGRGLMDVFDEAILAAISRPRIFPVPETEPQRRQQRQCCPIL